MKQDLAFRQSGEGIDLELSKGDFTFDEGLETAVLCSLFTDAYVAPEELPEGFEDPKGWWADSISTRPNERFGSRMWLLDRGKLTVESKNAMKEYALSALAWLIEDGIASKIQATTEILSGQGISLKVNIYKPSGEDIPFKFLWDGQALRKA